MQKDWTISSTVIPLSDTNIDTDRIIPARFLKSTSRANLSEALFSDERYSSNGEKKADFPLNDKKYSGSILIAGYNFGCGSSREHAVWALVDYGFKAVISSFFADIFKNNSLNNSLLPIQVSESFLSFCFEKVKNNTNTIISINLTKGIIDCENNTESFYINPYKKECIINGYDDIDYLCSLKENIKNFEKNIIF